MENTLSGILFFTGTLIGLAGTWAFMRSRQEKLKIRIIELELKLTHEQEQGQKQKEIFELAKNQLMDSFKALSMENLKESNQSFMMLAKQTFENFQQQARNDLEKRQQSIESVISPMKETLQKFDSKLQDVEKQRIGAYSGLTEQIKSLLEVQHQLKNEASNLVKALGTPRVRGRWGEIQLRRVVEMAGMLDHCDFEEQKSVTTDEGRLRPDLVVRLPAGKNIIVDAKAPLAAYLEAIEASDEKIRATKLADHARQIRDHLSSLSKKSYWEQFSPTPEFVILFLPGETFFSAALEYDPTLIEQGVEQKVILATPTTLIALLKAVAYGWRQNELAINAKAISDLGKELYKRIFDMTGHFDSLGDKLDKAVDSYNKAVGTFESRVLVSARRFKELKATTDDDIDVLQSIDKNTRALQANELKNSNSNSDT